MKKGLSYFKKIVFLVLITLFAYSLSANQSDEVKNLKARIAALENRVAKLEALVGNSKTNEIEYSEKWKDRTIWRKLKIGMTKDQVRQLLGEPRKINAGSVTHWYYSKETWHCYITFYNGRIDSWKEPD
jgi:hypothetical protein